jgi:hypothetical protein
LVSRVNETNQITEMNQSNLAKHER